MTEEEAKDKYCPIIQVKGPQRCLGSRCMLWRWTSHPFVEEGTESIVVTETGGHKYVRQSAKLVHNPKRAGECGLMNRGYHV